MEFRALPIPDVVLFTPEVFGDERGFFFESYNAGDFSRATGLDPVFVQDNHSRSRRGVLRGLHYQLPPHAQGKLLRVLDGEIYDVAVDIRRSSPFFGRWLGKTLSSENKHMLWIPPGFAHGFITMSETADVLYKTTDFYAPETERCIMWNDPALDIDWIFKGKPTLSAKDRQGVPLAAAELFE